jgi:hypothetical protein
LKKKLFLSGFIFWVLLFYFSFSEAQITMPNDTLRVGGGTYAKDIIQVSQGQTKVPVDVYLRNTFGVAGFFIRLVYDSTLMSPRTPKDSSFRLVRGSSLSAYDGDFSKAGQITFYAVAYGFEEIATGSGILVEFYFNIKSNAPEGPYTITLKDDSVNSFYNYLSDGSSDYIPVLSSGTICVGNCSPPENHSPVLNPVSPKSVVAGQTLTFSVNATDEDNDPITITAQNIPENSSFPQAEGTGNATGTFTFTPAAEQAPDTISVTFIVRDKYLLADTITVTIYIYEETQPPQEPTDKLKILSTEGGVPGSKNKLVPVYFINDQDTVYGIEFTLNYDSNAVIIDSLVPAPRANGFSIYSNLRDTLGKLTVLLFGLGNEKILPDSGNILYLALSVDSLAPFGNSLLDLRSAYEAISIDPNDSARSLAMTDGVFAVDRFGDVNLDKIINIGDIVSLVAYILGNISLDTRHWDAADINQDSSVNVGDLVGVINTILGRPINAPMERLSKPLAYLHLDYDSLQAGSEGKINLWADLKTPVAGVQLKIKYDPEQLTFSAPSLTSRSTGLNILYKDDGKGNLSVLFYRFFGKPIDPGEGNILSLPVTVKPGFDKEKLQLYLKEAILSDPEAVVIPVDKGEVILPKSFNLSQNYPNPFNPNTTIRFEIGTGSGNQAAVNTTLKVYNILGQVVKTLVNEPKLPGIYYQIWDGKNEQGEKVSSGLYFYQLRAGNYSETKKMVLLK